MALLDSAAASEERGDEDDDTDDYHENRYREKPYVHEVAVTLVPNEESCAQYCESYTAYL